MCCDDSIIFFVHFLLCFTYHSVCFSLFPSHFLICSRAFTTQKKNYSSLDLCSIIGCTFCLGSLNMLKYPYNQMCKKDDCLFIFKFIAVFYCKLEHKAGELIIFRISFFCVWNRNLKLTWMAMETYTPVRFWTVTQ